MMLLWKPTLLNLNSDGFFNSGWMFANKNSVVKRNRWNIDRSHLKWTKMLDLGIEETFLVMKSNK